jgi:cellulose biosynthesis protein BcsQ
LSRIFDALRRADLARARTADVFAAEPGPVQTSLPLASPPYDGVQVVTVTSNKGGVGKTTLATNLAVYLRALDEDLPILVLTLDDQPAIDRMFALDGRTATPDIADALRQGTLARAIRFGQYGVHYVPSSRRVAEIKSTVRSDDVLRAVLLRTGWRGVVIIDTKSDLEMLTRNAIAAADLSLVVVKDQISVLEAERVFALLEGWGRPRERARIVLSLVDLRIRYREGDTHDVLGLLVQEVRRRGLPLFETFVSRSPKVESLYTNPDGHALSILHGAAGTPVHGQMHRLAEEVRGALEALRKRAPAAPAASAHAAASSEYGIARMKRWLLQGGHLGPRA